MTPFGENTEASLERASKLHSMEPFEIGEFAAVVNAILDTLNSDVKELKQSSKELYLIKERLLRLESQVASISSSLRELEGTVQWVNRTIIGAILLALVGLVLGIK